MKNSLLLWQNKKFHFHRQGNLIITKLGSLIRVPECHVYYDSDILIKFENRLEIKIEEAGIRSISGNKSMDT